MVFIWLQVQVSMKFTGRSSVEVHPPSNPEELKTVTSISLFMRVDPDKDPIEDRFILYLGDRSVRNPGRLHFLGLEKSCLPWLEAGGHGKERAAKRRGAFVVILAVSVKSFEASQLAQTEGFQETPETKVQLFPFNLEFICSSPWLFQLSASQCGFSGSLLFSMELSVQFRIIWNNSPCINLNGMHTWEPDI